MLDAILDFFFFVLWAALLILALLVLAFMAVEMWRFFGAFEPHRFNLPSLCWR